MDSANSPGVQRGELYSQARGGRSAKQLSVPFRAPFYFNATVTAFSVLPTGPIIIIKFYLFACLLQLTEFIVRFDEDNEHWVLDTRRPHQYRLEATVTPSSRSRMLRVEGTTTVDQEEQIPECSICMTAFALMPGTAEVYKLGCGKILHHS